MNDDIRDALEDAGRRDVPPPSPGFSARLETRLLQLTKDGLPPAPPEPHRRWSTLGLVASLTAAAILVVGVVVTGGPDRPDVALELADPVNVVVVLADGTTLLDPDGLLLPDGASIRVGDGGSARIGDSILRAGDSATIDARRLRIDRRPRSAVSDPGRTARPTDHRTEPPRPTRSPSSTPRPTPTRSPTPTRQEPTPTPHPTPSPTRPPTEEPTPTASPTPPAAVKPPKLGVRVSGPAEVQVLWTRVRGAHRYILIGTHARRSPAADPVYPGSRVVGRFARRPTDPVTIVVKPAVVELRLQVIAIGAGGRELARSKIVTVTFPR